MSPISQIINELADPSISLLSPMLKIQVFASRVGNTALKAWVANELNGYEDGKDVPEYRRYQSHLSMDYRMGVYAPTMTNQPVNPRYLPLEKAKELVITELTDSVTGLETIRDKNPDKIGFAVSAALRNDYQNGVRSSGGVNKRIEILDLRKELSGTIPAQALTAIRQKLLDFMLAIAAEYGEETDIVQLQQHSQNITTIVHTTINNSGHGAVINTGAGATMTTSSVINIGSRDELANRLREQAVSEPDIAELLTVIDQQSPDPSSGRFSQPVNNWITKMVNKALEQTWPLAVSTAAGVLTELIKAYYGMGKQ